MGGRGENEKKEGNLRESTAGGRKMERGGVITGGDTSVIFQGERSYWTKGKTLT